MAELPEVPSTSSSSFPSTNLSLSCVSCGMRVEELKCLPCLHSLALCEKVECQEKMLQLGVTCEICDDVFSIPPSDLPSHPFALRKTVSSQYQKEGVVCQEEHEEKRAAVSYCSDCDFFICQECVDLHRSKKMFKRHQIQSINETLEGGSTKSADAVGEIFAMKEQLIAMVTGRCDSLVGKVRKTEAMFLSSREKGFKLK